LIADPAQQPRWDGNDNLAMAPGGQRVRSAGDVFTMTLTKGSVRENHVVEFEEGRRLAWMPAEAGKRPPGHLWRWELEPIGTSRTRVTQTYDTRVTQTYDWTQLTDKNAFREPGRLQRTGSGPRSTGSRPSPNNLTALCKCRPRQHSPPGSSGETDPWGAGPSVWFTSGPLVRSARVFE